MLTSFAGKHVLLLQGPMGPFFWRLRKDLEAAGAHVSKINFCAADALFYPLNAAAYRGPLEQWPRFFTQFVVQHGIDAVFLFGDCRPYHSAIRQASRWLQTELFVFEEGYLRPDYITIERGGVNNHSSIPRDPEAFLRVESAGESESVVFPAKNSFRRAAVYATLYSITNFLFGWFYPHYSHHRPLNPFREAFSWIRGLVRKAWFQHKESGLLPLFETALSGRYFLVPLQVHNDAQITSHSRFGSIEEVIGTIVSSFVAHADQNEALVFKHHPMDRAYRDYTSLFSRLTQEHGLQGRLFYVHDLHLPKLLKHARGTVVVNSTVGLSSLHHGTPVFALGDPIYNLPGLTFQGDLAEFWRDPGSFDEQLLKGFRTWLQKHNQANGNFYRPIEEALNTTGVFWPGFVSPKHQMPARPEHPQVVPVQHIDAA